MAGSSVHSTNGAASLPKDPHSALVIRQTNCGNTVFVLDLLEVPYYGIFQHIVILCPSQA